MLTDENNAFGPAQDTSRTTRGSFPTRTRAALRGAFSPRRVLRHGHDVRGSHAAEEEGDAAAAECDAAAVEVDQVPAAAAPAQPAAPAAAAAAVPHNHVAGLGLGLLLK